MNLRDTNVNRNQKYLYSELFSFILLDLDITHAVVILIYYKQ